MISHEVFIQLLSMFQENDILREDEEELERQISSWKSATTGPPMVFVLKRAWGEEINPPFIQLVTWLINEEIDVIVENAIIEEEGLVSYPGFGDVKSSLKIFKEEDERQIDNIDFICCLGGDGTLLYASSLFQKFMPPILAFNFGSLGFLASINFDDFESELNNVLEGHAKIMLRARLRCILTTKNNPDALFEDEGLETNQLVLNEVVIHRGSSPHLCNLDLYLDGKLITSVQGDGLILSTPTGSTAYAASAGASMVHPGVAAIMVTPICPHSLSFRPILVPATVEVKVALSPNSRNTFATVSYDGGHNFCQKLNLGDTLKVTTSSYSVPSICGKKHCEVSDWCNSLAKDLQWNFNTKQKP